MSSVSNGQQNFPGLTAEQAFEALQPCADRLFIDDLGAIVVKLPEGYGQREWVSINSPIAQTWIRGFIHDQTGVIVRADVLTRVTEIMRHRALVSGQPLPGGSDWESCLETHRSKDPLLDAFLVFLANRRDEQEEKGEQGEPLFFGAPTELLERIKDEAGSQWHRAQIKANAAHLSRRLNKLQPLLNRLGLALQRDRRSAARSITIVPIEATQSQPDDDTSQIASS